MSTKRRLRIASYGNNVGVKDMIRLRQIEEYQNSLKVKPYKQQYEDYNTKLNRIEQFNKTYMEMRNPKINKKIVSPIGGSNNDSYKSNFNEIKHIFDKYNPRTEDRVFAHSLRSGDNILRSRAKRATTSYQPTNFTERVDFTLNHNKTLNDIKQKSNNLPLSNYDHILRPTRGKNQDLNTANFTVNLRVYNQDKKLEKLYSTLPKVPKKGIVPYKDDCSIPLSVDKQQYKTMLMEKSQKLQELKEKTMQINNNKTFANSYK